MSIDRNRLPGASANVGRNVTPPQGPVSAVVEAGSNEGHRNVGVAAFMTFAAFLGLGFALPFLPIFVQDLGVRDPGEAAQWAGCLLYTSPSPRD